MEELDQYLTGQMSQQERSRFEEQLARDPQLQAAMTVQEGLRQLRLQKKVGEAAAARKEWERRKNWRWLFTSIGIAGLACLAFFFITKSSTTDIAPVGQPTELMPTNEAVPNPPTIQPTKNEESVPVPLAKDKAQDKTIPIADNSELKAPPYHSPNIRGQGSEDLALKALLDQIWYTKYPLSGKTLDAPISEAGKLLEARDFDKAYVQLQRLERKTMPSDTLRFLKGYCLMEMGEGTEALAYFEQLEQTHPEWAYQLQWFRGLSLVLASDRNRALAAFKEIAARPSHPFRLQSAKAAALLDIRRN